MQFSPANMHIFVTRALAFGVSFVVLFFLLYSPGEPTDYLSHVPVKNDASSMLCRTLPESEGDVSLDIQYLTSPLLARSAFVYDATTGSVLFAKESDTLRPLASVTKLLTAATVLSNENTTTRIALADSALHDHIPPFQKGEIWEVGRLTSLMLVRSSNDAARALAIGVGSRLADSENEAVAERAFFRAMSEQASHWHLSQMLSFGIKSVSGLDETGNIPTVMGTAEESAQLLLCAYEQYPAIVAQTQNTTVTYQNISGKTYTVDNTNRIIADIPGLLASKTGLTESAGGNLVLLYKADNGHIIAVSVLGSTKDGRFSDARALVVATNTLLTTREH